ncbi:helix-turn-helix domain-containing protein [Actinosynnema sp. NPDC050436]|uniref:helix-turn-helix domain-containing protein n=1 Tax=Actinosynnema sp. NPDC050436 TaxID=3155659 RepID=UPI0033EAF637
MDTIFRATDHPVAERFERWAELVPRVFAPLRLSVAEPDRHRSELRVAELGGTMAYYVASSTSRVERTDRMIRQADPDVVRVALVEHGDVVFGQDVTPRVVEPCRLYVSTSWRPFELSGAVPGGGMNVTRSAVVPFGRLSMPRGQVERLGGVAVPAGGLTDLVTASLRELTTHDFGPADASRLGSVLVDLVAALVAHLLDRTSDLPAQTREQALLAQAEAFIQANLGDPGLTPAAVAAAHHVGLRTMQRLFRRQDRGLADWIRHRRLEACHRDLTDPRLLSQPVHLIGRRWGFTDPSHFSRVFRAAFGSPPGDYREHQTPTSSPCTAQLALAPSGDLP